MVRLDEVDPVALRLTMQPCDEGCARRVIVEHRPDGTLVERCQVCWRRHVRLVAEPGVIGLRLPT